MVVLVADPALQELAQKHFRQQSLIEDCSCLYNIDLEPYQFSSATIFTLLWCKTHALYSVFSACLQVVLNEGLLCELQPQAPLLPPSKSPPGVEHHSHFFLYKPIVTLQRSIQLLIYLVEWTVCCFVSITSHGQTTAGKLSLSSPSDYRYFLFFSYSYFKLAILSPYPTAKKVQWLISPVLVLLTFRNKCQVDSLSGRQERGIVLCYSKNLGTIFLTFLQYSLYYIS